MGKVRKKSVTAKKVKGSGKSTKASSKKSTTAKKRVASAKSGTADSNKAYVLPLGNGWVVKNSNAKVFLAITDSKTEAISIGRQLAKTQHTELVVHGKQGNIEKRESYIIK